MHFTFSFPVTLTFKTQICSPSYSSPVLCFTKLEVSAAFLIRENLRHRVDGQTDELGAALNAAP